MVATVSSTATTLKALRTASICVQVCERIGIPLDLAGGIHADDSLLTALAHAVQRELTLYNERLATDAVLTEGRFNFVGVNHIARLIAAEHPQRAEVMRRLNNDWRAVDVLLRKMTRKQREAIIMWTGARDGYEQTLSQVAETMGNSIESVEALIRKGLQNAVRAINSVGLDALSTPLPVEPVALMLLPVGAVFRLVAGDDQEYVVEMQSSPDHPGGLRTAAQPTTKSPTSTEPKKPVKFLESREMVIPIA